MFHKQPFLTLNEKQDFEEAGCGCVLQRNDNDNHSVVLCSIHHVAPQLLEVCRLALTAFNIKPNFAAGGTTSYQIASQIDAILKTLNKKGSI